jgi:DHA1 family inner membrane transport protein
VLYVGQAIGSGIGGLLYAGGHFYASGFVAMAFVALALVTVIATRPGHIETLQSRRIKP